MLMSGCITYTTNHKMELFNVAAKKKAEVTCYCNLALAGLLPTLVVATLLPSAFQSNIALKKTTLPTIHKASHDWKFSR